MKFCIGFILVSILIFMSCNKDELNYIDITILRPADGALVSTLDSLITVSLNIQSNNEMYHMSVLIKDADEDTLIFDEVDINTPAPTFIFRDSVLVAPLDSGSVCSIYVSACEDENCTEKVEKISFFTIVN